MLTLCKLVLEPLAAVFGKSQRHAGEYSGMDLG